MGYGISIVVDGDYACFTRPEMKVERVSYDVPTPSALEGLLKSVYWKPAIRYVIDKIIVCNPINFTNIRRNEVKEKVKISAKQMKEKNPPDFYTVDKRTQRSSMILKNVKYGISFHFELTGIRSEKDDECEEKHYNIILRRLRNGQCFRQPVLGCREFAVRSITLADSLDNLDVDGTLKGERDLGYMLYGLKFTGDDWEKHKFSDAADAVYYRPKMIDGVIDVAKYRRNTVC